jgi:hypothetical protein
MSKKHKDLEFHVDTQDGLGTRVFNTFEEAAVMAIARSAGNGDPATIDVLTYSRAGAKAWQGDHGVEVYNEDPDASVHERIVVRAESQGRIA